MVQMAIYCLLLAVARSTTSSVMVEGNSLPRNASRALKQPTQVLTPTPLFPAPTTYGAIEDSTCDVEQLENANDSQLYSILHELRHTAFFRSFAVDLDESCPLSTWGKKKIAADVVPSKDNESSKDTPSQKEEEEDVGICASEGLPDLDPDAEPACSIDTTDDAAAMPWQTGGGGFSTGAGFTNPKASFDSGMPSRELQTEKENTKKVQETKEEVNANEQLSPSDGNEETEEYDEFECTGGEEELDEDDAPLCDLTEEDMIPPTPVKDFFSSALKSISEKMGWESQSEKETFAWLNQSNPVVLNGEEEDLSPCDDQEDGGKLPETFWVDMCSNIKMGERSKTVNLVLNPERNTGYNGTHIWKAIYDENCIAMDGSPSAPMCYEERVLYRLLSGLHTSTTLSIATNYYPPSKRKKRENWEPNPQYFMDKFAEHPEYIRDLHFSYLVLLRALRKASPFLYNYDIATGNIVDDETATIMLKRLLDSTILQSCNGVFTAFDESLMFQGREQIGETTLLQQKFKGVFHNISSILDCVQCQQCRLHGKMAMLGYGTALKILFLPSEKLIASSLSRNEIVAFINTIGKLSESLKEVRELTTLYWVSKDHDDIQVIPPPVAEMDAVELAVAAISALNKAGEISDQRETELVRLALTHDSNLLILAKYYGLDLNKFLLHSQSIGGTEQVVVNADDEPDAIVVGSGLAGLAATLNILDRGGKVVVIEKEHLLGGNSNKASSGINAYTHTDDLDIFRNDTTGSAGNGAQLPLIDTLVKNSADAVEWLKTRVGVDLSLKAQLGGHSEMRTHRPSNGMAGAEIMYGMQKAVKKYEESGMVKILVDTQVTKLVHDETGRVIGVEIKILAGEGDDEHTSISSPNVILATGGFAADRRMESYLAQYRPELLKMPATAGEFSTGDGIGLATKLGAGTVNMDKVQIHPTGWVDPADPLNPSKILAAELMRGVGGILINNSGNRFCNELGTRAYVTDKMFAHDPQYLETHEWNPDNDIPNFSLVLSSSAALDGKKHMDLYTHKGLLTKLTGIQALADWMSQDVEVLRATMEEYQRNAEAGVDSWGKSNFRGVPKLNLDDEIFFAGTVVPVLHYCMGGITIDTEGNVLNENKTVIPGLHAAGEVAGGVHGDNRLGGNSLLECTVYGTIVGKKIPIKRRTSTSYAGFVKQTQQQELKTREISLVELQNHNTPEDCWVALHGTVYDLTDFAEEHPPGAESIYNLAGQDGTEAFQIVHSIGMLDEFKGDAVGVFTN